ncbi:ATP synthase F0 subunit C [Candidatus Riflebacteria bacterium]
MYTFSWLAFSAAFAMAIGGSAAAYGLGRAISATMDAVARQPEAAKDLQTMMIIGAAMIEAIAIYCLVIAFLIQFKIPSFTLEVLKGLKY